MGKHDEDVLMILTLEDFAVIFTMLSPVYYLSYAHIHKIAKLDARINVLENRLSGILKLSKGD